MIHGVQNASSLSKGYSRNTFQYTRRVVTQLQAYPWNLSSIISNHTAEICPRFE